MHTTHRPRRSHSHGIVFFFFGSLQSRLLLHIHPSSSHHKLQSANLNKEIASVQSRLKVAAFWHNQTMLASKPKASLSAPSNHKEPPNSNSNSSHSSSRAHASAPSAPRVSRLAKPAAGSSKHAAEARTPSPLRNSARASTPLDKSIDVAPKPSPAGANRQSFKASPHRTTTAGTSTPDRQPRIGKASELQAQLNVVQEDLKNAREHLASIDRDRAQVHDDLALTKKLADEAYQKLEDSLAGQRRAEEALELERFKSIEREQASIELARRKEEEWQRKYDGERKRHAEDVASLGKLTKELENAKGELAVMVQAKNLAISRADKNEKMAHANAKKAEILVAEVTKELENAKDELAVMVQARNSAISRADEAEKIADANVKKAKILMAEVTKELENARGELAVMVQAKNLAVSRADKTEKIAEASAKKAEILMAEVTRLKSEMENRAEEAAETIGKLRSEASELRAELQRAMAFQEKLAKTEEVVEGLKVDIAYAKRAEMDVNQSAHGWKTKAESLEARLVEITSLNKSNEESLASMTKGLDDTRSQLLQIKEKAASSESKAIEYKEGFLETNRRLDIARKEASELQEAIDRLRSEHELLNEAHRQVVTSEKAASAQAGVLSDDKGRLVQELDDAREERDKAKKAVEDLAAALRQVSSEAREAKERVLTKQTELDHAQLQISELKAAAKNAQDKYQLMLEESRKTVEKMDSEAKISEDEWVSKEAGFMEMLKRSEEGASSIRSEMSKLMASLTVAEKEVQELKAERTQLVHELKGLDRYTVDASPIAEESMAESSRLKDQLSSKEEVLALNHERLRETAALAKGDELSKLLAEATMKAGEEEAAKNSDKSKALLIKLEMDTVLESLKAAEREARAAKDETVQLQSKLRLVESKITEANLTAEEEKICSLRLKETLAEKEEELLSIARENDGLRAREAAARAKADELASLLLDQSNGGAVRSSEKQPNVFLKMMCSPMDNVVRGDHEARKNSDRIVQVEEIKHVEVETVKQVRHEREEEVSVSAVEANSLENSKIIEDDLSKEIRSSGIDTESSDGDDIDSQGDDGVVDHMDGLLIHGPTSSFKQEQHSSKKKKALLKKFGSMLKKKAHFTKLSNHP